MNRKLEFRAPNEDLVIVESAIPQPPPDGAVVKIHYAGICHSDVHIWENKFDLGGGNTIKPCEAPSFKLPQVLAESLAVGTKVIVYPWHGCKQCARCKDKEYSYCPKGDSLSMGVCQQGGYQEYVAVKEMEYLFALPDGLPMDVAALMPCSGVTAYHAIIDVQKTVETFCSGFGKAALLIIGAGGLGLWGIQIAKYLMPKETTIIVAEAFESKFEAARAAGADETVLWAPDAKPKDNIASVKAVAPTGVCAVADFVGSSSTTTSGFGCLTFGGNMKIIGLFGGLLMAPGPLIPLRINSVSGVKYGDPKHMVEVIKLAAGGKIDAPPITHVKLEETQKVLEDLKAGTRRGRTVIKHQSA